jgi:ankyrin repeat protein
VDYSGCLAVLLRSEQHVAAIINRQDLLGNTALHYATQFWSQATVTQLLLLGTTHM